MFVRISSLYSFQAYRISDLEDGSHFHNSLDQLETTLLGQTINIGLFILRNSFRKPIIPIAYIVLPKPISSANTHEKPN